MMKMRKSMSRKANKGNFRAHVVRIEYKNISPRPMRGGIRL